MKKNVKIKSLFLLCFGLFMGTYGYGQSTVFANSSATYAGLDATQQGNYDKIVAKGYYSSLSFIDYDGEALYDATGYLTFDVGNFLDSINFKATRTTFDSPTNFEWSGQYFDGDSLSANAASSLSFLAHDGRIFGSIQTDKDNFQIYDLTGGVLVLAKYDKTVNVGKSYTCGNETGLQEVGEIAERNPNECSVNKLKILVVYTEGAAAEEPDELGLAQACVLDLNNIWAYSGSYNLATLAGVVTVNSIVESEALVPLLPYDLDDVISGDLFQFRNKAVIQNLRTQYKADIVVFLTKHIYKSNNKEFFGVATQLGTDFNSAYCLVTNKEPITRMHSFAHEVNHLFGALHNIEDLGTPFGFGYNHAFKFFTGSWPFRNSRRTLMHVLDNDNQEHIQRLSNPNINYLGVSTGRTDMQNNARIVTEWGPTISDFYTDWVPFSVTLNMVQAANCQNTGTATAIIPQECEGPFTYQWSYSDNGITWTILANNTATIGTFVPSSIGSFNARQYKVKAIGFTGNATVQSTAEYQCLQKVEYPGGPMLRPGKGDLTSVNSIDLSPNPVDNNYQLKINITEADNVVIDLFDMNGRKVADLFEGNLAKGENTLNFKRNFEVGVYILKVNGKNAILQTKLIAK